MPDARAQPPTSRLLASALVLVTVTVLALSALRMARSLPRESHLGYTEGTWIALAIDTAQGVFYRPLEGPLGYGGARYFPMFFTLHASAVRLGVSPVGAGQALSVGSIALLIVGIVLFLRRTGSGSILSFGAAAVALMTQPVQLALLTIRGDGLPAALTVLGLAACLGPRMSAGAPALFVLAFAAKPTSLYGPAAAVIVLLLAERRREAAALGLWVAVGVAATLGLMWAASGHRVFSIFAASASGGAGWTSLLVAPRSLARILSRTPEVIVLLGAAAAAVWGARRRPLPLEVVAGTICLAVTTAIYASPATVENHLIDLTVMATLILGASTARLTRVGWRTAMLLLAGAIALWTAAERFSAEDGREWRQSRLAAREAVANVPRPVFFEQPMLAGDGGESSYWLDPYLVAVRAAENPAILRRFLDDIDRRAFGAIVLEQVSPDLWFTDVGSESAREIRDAITRRYALASVVDGRAIYRPR